MALAEDLLHHARQIADTSNPNEAALRRAISTAYYAVFHLLAADIASQSAPATPPRLRERVLRALEHSSMKQTARDFCAEPSITDSVLKDLLRDPAAVSPQLKSVAKAFAELQAARHEADYDLTAQFDSVRAQGLVASAEQLFTDWSAERGTDDARVFLASMSFRKAWSK